ncbi:MAG: IS1634 family transposase [Thermoplasmataceae archaeon]
MAIRRRKVGNAIYLEEYKSRRVHGKVVTEFVRYVGKENEEKKIIESTKIIDRVKSTGSARAGDINLLWAIAQDLNIPFIIDQKRYGNSTISVGKVLTAWAINRVIDPESATQLESWVKTTDIPRLSGIDMDKWSKDLFLDSLDAICFDDRTTKELKDLSGNIDREIFMQWRKKHPLKGKDHVAYDLTTALFFGTSCPLAEFGYNPGHLNRRQINIAMMVSREDYQPEYHAVFEGSRSGSTTVRNMLAVLPKLKKDESGLKEDESPGTIIWDRGNISMKNVKDLESTSWNLISGIPKSVKQARSIMEDTDIKEKPQNFIRRTKIANVYAELVHRELYGKERNIAVYVNPLKALNEREERNSELARIGKEIDNLSERCVDWDESKIHAEISRIVGEWERYIDVKINRKSKNIGKRIEWRYHSHAINASERLDGKSAILCTDPKLSAEEIVNMYLEKDYVEKVFRTMKSQEEITPVRHRLERRVRAYVFVMVTAYRLIANLVYLLRESGEKEPWEISQKLLDSLSRVERTEITFGKEMKILYLNLRPESLKLLQKIGYGKLFDEKNQETLV